jgi:hypothetical protein
MIVMGPPRWWRRRDRWDRRDARRCSGSQRVDAAEELLLERSRDASLTY